MKPTSTTRRHKGATHHAGDSRALAKPYGRSSAGQCWADSPIFSTTTKSPYEAALSGHLVAAQGDPRRVPRHVMPRRASHRARQKLLK